MIDRLGRRMQAGSGSGAVGSKRVVPKEWHSHDSLWQAAD